MPTPLSAVSANITETVLMSTTPGSTTETVDTELAISIARAAQIKSIMDDPYREMSDVELAQALQAGPVPFRLVSEPTPAATPQDSISGTATPASPGSVSGALLASATATPSLTTSTAPTPTPSIDPAFIDFDSDEPEPEPEPEKEETSSTSFIRGTVVVASLASSLSPIDVKTIGKVNSNNLRKRDLVPRDIRPRALTRVPRNYKGLRGVLVHDDKIKDRPWPTEVSCTKTYIHETTIWAPTAYAPTYIAPQPVTIDVISVSTVTTTKVVPDRSPFKTVSFISRTTLTTTTTFKATSTTTDTLTWTRTSTSSSFAACATPQNVMGPLAVNASRIVNVYNRGSKDYSMFTLGHTRNPEDCCIECHTLHMPCTGSVFADGKCHLFTAPDSKCRSQGGAASFFVTRPDGEHWPKRYGVPEFQISNGPCGYMYDAGTGW